MSGVRLELRLPWQFALRVDCRREREIGRPEWPMASLIDCGNFSSRTAGGTALSRSLLPSCTPPRLSSRRSSKITSNCQPYISPLNLTPPPRPLFPSSPSPHLHSTSLHLSSCHPPQPDVLTNPPQPPPVDSSQSSKTTLLPPPALPPLRPHQQQRVGNL